MGKKSGAHTAYDEYKDLHKQGACLARHQHYQVGHLCSHRWQAKLRADSDARYTTAKLAQPDNWRARTVERFKEAGKLRWVPLLGLFALDPFATEWWPWGNQAHHLIPDAELRTQIMVFAEPEPEVADLIIRGLFEDSYNLNDKANMIPLPTETRVALQIGLPTHVGSHPTYSRQVGDLVYDAVETVYDGIKQSYVQKQKEHDAVEPAALKGRLVAISNGMYEQMWAYGAQLKAQSATDTHVNNMPSSFFNL